MDQPVLLEYLHKCLESLAQQYAPGKARQMIEVPSPVPFEPDPLQEYGLTAIYHFFEEANRRVDKDRTLNVEIEGREGKLTFLLEPSDRLQFARWVRAIENNAVAVIEDMSIRWDVQMRDDKVCFLHDNQNGILIPLVAINLANEISRNKQDTRIDDFKAQLRVTEDSIDEFLAPIGIKNDDLFSMACMKKEFLKRRNNTSILTI